MLMGSLSCRWSSILVCIAILSVRAEKSDVAEKQQVNMDSKYANDTPIVVKSPAIIEVDPGTEISSFGSKVLVRPMNVTWGECLAAMEWEGGVPAIMDNADKSKRNFYFDLIQKTKIVNRTMLLKLERVTVADNDTAEMDLTISAGSPIITIHSAGSKADAKKEPSLKK